MCMCAPVVVQKMLDNFIAPYDATVVEKLQAAGVVKLGKTNLDDVCNGVV